MNKLIHIVMFTLDPDIGQFITDGVLIVPCKSDLLVTIGLGEELITLEETEHNHFIMPEEYEFDEYQQENIPPIYNRQISHITSEIHKVGDSYELSFYTYRVDSQENTEELQDYIDQYKPNTVKCCLGYDDEVIKYMRTTKVITLYISDETIGLLDLIDTDSIEVLHLYTDRESLYLDQLVKLKSLRKVVLGQMTSNILNSDVNYSDAIETLLSLGIKVELSYCDKIKFVPTDYGVLTKIGLSDESILVLLNKTNFSRYLKKYNKQVEVVAGNPLYNIPDIIDEVFNIDFPGNLTKFTVKCGTSDPVTFHFIDTINKLKRNIKVKSARTTIIS